MSRIDDPNPGECECCLYETSDLTLTDCYARTSGHGPFTLDADKEWGWLCLVCRSTLAGNTYMYPRQYEYNTAMVMQMMAWQTNFLAEVTRQALHSIPTTQKEDSHT